MSKANDHQVAGTHYQSSHQHWDLAHYLDLGYFEGQISKYITRHRAKNGKQDVEKALHFAQKLLELKQYHGRNAMHKYIPDDFLQIYIDENKLTSKEFGILRALLHWQTTHHLKTVCFLIGELLRTEYSA